MKVLIDNGHGVDTPDKRSPDGRFREFNYNRDIAKAVVRHLGYRGFDAQLLTPEEYGVSLEVRAERLNFWCQQLGKKNVCLISIHNNSSGNGCQWRSTRGWCCYASNDQTKGDKLVACLYRAAALWLPGHLIKKDLSDGAKEIENNLSFVSNSLCSAALTENLYLDNIEDCTFLESEKGRRAIIALHVEGIVDFVLKRY